MVFIDGVKYACATCIKGHRSTSCQHKDRVLLKIKGKGRPITQCTHCRELRKTQRVHIKFMTVDNSLTLYSSQSKSDLSIKSSSNDSFDLLNKIKLEESSINFENLSDSDKLKAENSNQRNHSVNNNVDYKDDNSLANTSSFSWNINNHHSSNLTIKSESMESTSSYYNIPKQNLQVNAIEGDSLAQNANQKYSNKMEEYDEKSGDLSGVLGAELCRGTSDELVNMIYSSFKSCPSANKNGNCCGSSSKSICRCGSGCKCEGCNSHTLRVDANSQVQPNLSIPKSCCSTAHIISKPKHTVIIDEDGVPLCGCGCKKPNSECSDCVENLCEERNEINAYGFNNEGNFHPLGICENDHMVELDPAGFIRARKKVRNIPASPCEANTLCRGIQKEHAYVGEYIKDIVIETLY
ncbi:18371_t:CDS:2 [Entrophospora sp. SA101]|nr:18371_t:CDS:2 [Entrophospora sp. SA101]